MVYDMFLARPSKALEKEILAYRQEHFDFGETNINGSAGLARSDDFNTWLKHALSVEKEQLSNDIAPASTYFSIDKADNHIIGSIQLRHVLTPALEKHGGHVGYGIRPLKRGKGYGKQQLLLVLDIARAMKIPKVLITCDKENIASSKTALSCGGVLTCENIYEGKEQLLYWIDLRQ